MTANDQPGTHPPSRAASTRDDVALIGACRRGDAAAWNELVERFGRLVYSIPRRYGMSAADADDVFQNVFIILHRKLDSLADESRLSAWLITTTHRECWRLGRRSDAAASLDERIVDVGSPHDDELARWEEQHLVRQALRRLGGRCEPLLLALFSSRLDAGYDAIADQLGMKIGSIGPTRARCFKKLEKILLEMGFQPDGSVPEPADASQTGAR